MEPTKTNRDESYYKTDKQTRQKQIMVAFGFTNFTNRQLSQHLNLPINSVTGRVKELRDRGAIEVKGKIWDSVTKRTVTVFGLATEQLKLF